jgi:hypothetical protein
LAGAINKPLSVPGGGGGEATQDYVRLIHQTPANTPGGATLANTWQVRPLNVLTHDTGALCTPAFPQFTLGPGNYTFRIVSVGFALLRMRTRLVDLTNAVNYNSDNAWPPGGQHSPCWITGQMILTTSASFQVEQIGLNGINPNGFGRQVENDTEVSIFCIGEFFQTSI